MPTTESQRINDLEQQSRELKRAKEILKRAARFFGRISTTNTRSVTIIDANRAEFGAGQDVGRDQVARLMRPASIEGVRRGRRVRARRLLVAGAVSTLLVE
jgi:hypothetical protein